MAYLIDTDILIFGLKGDQTVNKWMLDNQEIPKFISVISYGELMYGARKSDHPNKNIATTYRVADLFPILDINRGIIEVFGEIKAKLEIAGTRIEDMDLLIASTAIYMNLSLVTNNTKHFSRIDDLSLEDWKVY
jgi:Predicted nucleic acid-binding protein, contains PIN domain